MSKHTPEPWTITQHKDAQGGNDWYSIEADATLRVEVYDAYEYVPGQTRANAYLFFAAPKLLAACEEALYRFQKAGLAHLLVVDQLADAIDAAQPPEELS